MTTRTTQAADTAHETEVLVAGGGLTGLSAAVFLAWHGVAVTVVERHPGTLVHPRARSINPRTAELLRQVGLDDVVGRADGYESQLPSVHMLRAETLAGPETSRVEQRPPAGARDGQRVSPASWGMIDQDRLEGVLRAHAEHLGATVRFGHELVSLDEDATGVRARVRDGDGRPYELRASYAIGADGHASRVREAAGIPLHGPGALSHIVSMVFDADLTGPLRGRHDPGQGAFIASCHLSTPAEGTVLFPHGRPHRWVFNTPMFPERGDTLGDFDDARCTGIIRAAIGVPGLPVTLVPQLPDGTKVLAYRIGAAVAGSFRSGRIFLAGDAAHVMPPTGAFGAGTGIQDAHNLAWKLAAVLRGRAGQDLLETYDTERRPVADFTLGQALLLMHQRGALPIPLPSGHRPAEYDAVVFGHRYRSSAVVADEGDDEDTGAVPPALLRGQPGTRAPHVPVPGSAPASSLDWFGRGFALLVPDGDGAWAAAARTLGDRDLLVHVLGEEGAELHGVSGSGAVLVRPDGFVAWRCHGSSEEPAQVLAGVLDRVGCRAPSM
ncbi:FAD-dependent monooxygenase [Streptomyces morookaense]|uniref:FAD-dependent monooxygenase n=1 Tax=Streptomyces morookaense TaxID=1970 RepID=A0A7Y7B511_STRMO|nr:FAD-dependent monooxygenase [Streptomyces morookaense]NVK79144.1 FAD-dependent monooxygenase [Streptomyces morookaense]GHF28214.1 FAD-dependent oxidoreductase [Streptomyces morookaense]